MAVPRATYRLQLHAEFGFDDAAAVAEYLADLGVSHIYTSPYLQAAPGSAHGYDVVDHRRVNDELGGPEGHRRFVAALGEAGLGQVIDVVPNHMAIGPRTNRWWWDVLQRGRHSPFAEYFDIEWEPPGSTEIDRLLIPILGDHYGRVLERGEITVAADPDEGLVLRYFDHVLPLAPESIEIVGRDPDSITALNANVDALDALLEQQHYRLAYWRVGADELEYRRFFDISTLVGLRVESAEVFAATHQLILGWLSDGEVDGLRVDHPDGLLDPGAYFELLRAAAPDAWIVVEKILEPGEKIPSTWPVDGTTGYDHAHVVTRLLHDRRGEEPINALYVELTGGDSSEAVSDGSARDGGGDEEETWDELIYAAKIAVLRESLATDVERLTGWFKAVGEGHRRWRDFTRRELRETLVETAAAFEVYRTYVAPDGTASDADRRHIARAVRAASERRPDLDPDLFTFLELVLTGDLDEEPRPGPATQLRLRFQQLTGPAMAKGVEDTAFYDRVPLASLNEVGADPSCFALSRADVHQALEEAASERPRSMLALSTHDTKRSEDVRARLAVLSEIPGAWAEQARRWESTLLVPHRQAGDGLEGWPDPRAEYLLLQTLVGAHPLPVERAVAYMAKATKEAKRHTSWTNPNLDYDAAIEALVASVMADEGAMSEVAAFAETVTGPGRINSLAQKLITLTAPGVPDLYQGSELWDLSLVDPDNRRPVDFELRRNLLATIDQIDPAELMNQADRGVPKLAVIAAALRLRQAHPDWFNGVSYQPVWADGRGSSHMFGFRRGERVIALVTRLPVGLEAGGGWGDTTVQLPPGAWHDVISRTSHEGGTVEVAEIFRYLPVALLHDGGPRSGGRAWPS